MFVIPKEGVKVPYPNLRTRKYLTPEGDEVPDHDVYWLRRLRDGSVTVKQADAQKAPAAPAAIDEPAETEKTTEPAPAEPTPSSDTAHAA